MKGINFLLKRFFYVYDPGFFSLIYACKAMIAVCISGGLSYFLLGSPVVIWSVMMAMYIFFLNGFSSNKDMDGKYLVLFVVCVCAMIPLFSIWEGSLWLILPTMCLAFLIGISSLYNNDLPKIITMTLVNALVANIYATSHPDVEIWRCILAAMLGGGVAIGIRLFISFGQYGKFIQTQFVQMLFELSIMCENLGNHKDYDIIKIQILNHISLLKAKLSSQGAKIKDAHSIKNHKRALFYLYKLESMYYVIDSMHYSLESQSPQSHELIKHIQQEMITNLKELSSIFYGKKPTLHTSVFIAAVEQKIDWTWVNGLKIFYSKLESFIRIGHQEAKAFVENTPRKSFSEMRQSLRENPQPLHYALRYSGAMGMAMFVAQFFQIDHGAWIALGVISMMHPNITLIENTGKDSVFGSLIGLMLGFGLVTFLGDSTFIYILFVCNLFLVIYFKPYPLMLWTSITMLELVVMFSFVDQHFVQLIAYRFGDILLGLMFAFFTSKILYPSYSIDEILPKCKECLEKLNLLTQSLPYLETDSQILEYQNQLTRSINDFSNLTLQAKNEKHCAPLLITAFDDLLKDFEQLKTLNLILNERIIEFITHQPHHQTLLQNDLKALHVRYSMLCAMIESKPYYFKTDEDGRFLLKNTPLYPIMLDVFVIQNHFYDILHHKLGI
uniref:Integral membrane bound transporter domain-containing protein n=1 Tax=uncultured Helicobacter sp. TaxID=175537 RepID=A0A650EJV4_9HELI|nr:hypothetical protein Helico4rc_1500 [uncultured Helicobacter sp.]